ncbi:unnamed protein product, partial [Allacma fusca]
STVVVHEDLNSPNERRGPMSSSNKLRIICLIIWALLAFVFCVGRYSVIKFSAIKISADETSTTSYEKTRNATTMNEIFLEEYFKGRLPQDDTRILNYIKNHGFVKPPPSVNVSYNLQKPDIDPSMGQSE